MNKIKTPKEICASSSFIIYRILILLAAVMMFFPGINPARVSGLINKNMSLFTSGIDYSGLTAECARPFARGWVDQSTFILLLISSLLIIVSILVCSAGGCLSVGNNKCQRLGFKLSLGGSLGMGVGLVGIIISYVLISQTSNPDRVNPMFPNGIVFYSIVAILIFIATIVLMIVVPKEKLDAYGAPLTYSMESKYKLFLMFLPFAVLAFVFSYLPLYGWRYAFFDYRSGQQLSMDNFVWFKWFIQLFKNEATMRDVVRVLRNTLVMSGLGILTSWIPMVFAIFLSEVKSTNFKRFVQIFTTIPNFISWVLVYAIAFAIFSTEGFINDFLIGAGFMEAGDKINYLMSNSYTWVKMLAWGMWKGVGWSAIIYIAGISGIDQQLYEAATVDGAGRFAKMRHITVPGLLPTYCVLLLMSIAGILSNGMDQYLVFKNANNAQTIEVLDLYIYTLGIQDGNIPLSTVIGMSKSIISVALLFTANRISKAIRGESII